MTQKRILVALLGAVLLMVPVAIVAQTRTAAAPATQPTQPAYPGRFVMMGTPPTAQGNSGFDNFIWVLDTQTGNVDVHRIMQVKDDKGELSYWAHETLIDQDVVLRMNNKR